MEQFIILTRERYWENEKWSDFFTVKDSTDPEQNFRDAIHEYLLTEDGMEMIKKTSDDFNWGDAIMYVPDDIWNKYGIKPIEEGDSISFTQPITIWVDQDEVLVPDEYYRLDDEEEIE